MQARMVSRCVGSNRVDHVMQHTRMLCPLRRCHGWLAVERPEKKRMFPQKWLGICYRGAGRLGLCCLASAACISGVGARVELTDPHG
jgi:hypothetical protein